MIIKYRDKSFRGEEVLKHLALTGQIGPLLFEIIKSREVVSKARELGLEVSDQQLQDFADTFRMANGMYTAQETYNFLNGHGLSDEDFEDYCETSVLVGLLREHMGDENKVRDYFINHRAQFDRARISVIAVAKADMANEIRLQLDEEELDFPEAAAKYSLDLSSKHLGGHVGSVPRQEFPSEVSAKVFNATPDELLGPFEIADSYQIIQVHEVRRAELTPEIEEVIKDHILDEWAHRAIGGEIAIHS